MFVCTSGVYKRKGKDGSVSPKNMYLKEEWFLVAIVTNVFLLMVLLSGFMVTVTFSVHNFLSSHTVGQRGERLEEPSMAKS